MDLRPGDVDPLRPRDAEVPGDLFEAVAREIARDEVVAADRVERVNQLAPRDREAGLLAARSLQVALEQRRTGGSTEREQTST